MPLRPIRLHTCCLTFHRFEPAVKQEPFVFGSICEDEKLNISEMTMVSVGDGYIGFEECH